jgi:hypothetical protein
MNVMQGEVHHKFFASLLWVFINFCYIDLIVTIKIYLNDIDTPAWCDLRIVNFIFFIVLWSSVILCLLCSGSLYSDRYIIRYLKWRRMSSLQYVVLMVCGACNSMSSQFITRSQTCHIKWRFISHSDLHHIFSIPCRFNISTETTKIYYSLHDVRTYLIKLYIQLLFDTD